jgi:hypothetical protein
MARDAAAGRRYPLIQNIVLYLMVFFNSIIYLKSSKNRAKMRQKQGASLALTMHLLTTIAACAKYTVS